MKLELKVYNCLCETEVFKINGISADYEDFGTKDDIDRENAEDYCCGDMTFEPKNATDEILNKYKINNKEYDEICNELIDKLSFGSCGWCS